MAFAGVEFANDESLAVVSSKWLTPRKKQVFWTPVKHQELYDKAVIKGSEPDENTWQLYNITRCFFYTDDFQDARAKLKIAECTSDIPDTIIEPEEGSNVKRRRAAPKRFSPVCLNESCDDDSDNEPLLSKRNKTASQLPKNSCETSRRWSSQEDSEPYESLSNKPSKIISRPPRINCESFISELSPQSARSYCDSPQQTRAESSVGSATGSSHRFPPTNGLGRQTTTPRRSLNECLNTQFSLNLDEIEDENLTGKPVGQQIATYLSRILTQNRQILNMLTSIKKQNQMSASSTTLPENLPVTFPLETYDDIKLLEIHLKEKDNATALSLYLSSLGGKGTANQTNTILKFLIKDNLAAKFSFKGTRNNKKPFRDLELKTVIVRAVRGASSEITERAVEDLLKVWLKHAPERIAKKNKNNA